MFCIFVESMKKQTRKIISVILLMLVMSVVLHDIIPHHHHDNSEHESHLVCNDHDDHNSENHDSEDAGCNSHGAHEFETCKACHFTVEIIKEVKNQQFLFHGSMTELPQPAFKDFIQSKIICDAPLISDILFFGLKYRGPPGIA